MRFTHWDQVSTTETTNDILLKMSSWHLSFINDKELVRALHENLERGDLKGLCDVEIPYDRLSIEDAYHGRQIKSFFEKREDLDFTGGVGKEEVAWQAFLQSEINCKETNRRLRAVRRGEVKPSNRVSAVLHGAMRKMSIMLGNIPTVDELKIRFGPGATTQVKRRTASARAKLGQRPSCSKGFLPHLGAFLESVPGWLPKEDNWNSASVVLSHGKLTFVPKNAKTYRSIVVEPALNSMVQLGLDGYLKGRCMRFGLDLLDGQALNRAMAQTASVSGASATLDLSSASDNLATELVYDLLPLDWAFFLDDLRSKTVSYKGKVLVLEKFSSMGNGYTFPIESMIFFALATSVAEIEGSLEKVHVFGDDIIVGTDCVSLLREVLTFVGFTVNEKKSFTSGRFRESCGGDYLRGTDIRPLYIKRPLSGQDMFRLHNHYVRTNMDASEIILRYIDRSLRKWGPDGYGHGHLLGAWKRKPFKRSEGWSGYTFETYTYRKLKNFTIFDRDHVLPLYSVYMRSNPPVNTLEALTGRELEPDWFYERGELGTVVPGFKGYKLIKVYTLEG